MSKSNHFLFKIGAGLQAVAFLIVAFIPIRRTILSKTPALALGTGSEITPAPNAAISETSLVMPDLPTAGRAFENGIRRLSLLDTRIPNRPSVEVRTYEVQQGDNLF